jgi:hypothetical protein
MSTHQTRSGVPVMAVRFVPDPGTDPTVIRNNVLDWLDTEVREATDGWVFVAWRTPPGHGKRIAGLINAERAALARMLKNGEGG